MVPVSASARVPKVRGTLLALAAAGTLLGTAPGPAQAAPAPTPSGNWVRVAVVRGDTAVDPVREALLRCSPKAAGTHPQAARACRELAAVKGDINAIHVKETPCPMIYKPLTALAYGMWNGHRVAYAHDFANDCVLGASTGSLFALG
jgi:hypothetical protein